MTKLRIQADSYDEKKNTSQDRFDEIKNISRQLWRNEEYKPTDMMKRRIQTKIDLTK